MIDQQSTTSEARAATPFWPKTNWVPKEIDYDIYRSCGNPSASSGKPNRVGPQDDTGCPARRRARGTNPDLLLLSAFPFEQRNHPSTTHRHAAALPNAHSFVTHRGRDYITASVAWHALRYTSMHVTSIAKRSTHDRSHCQPCACQNSPAAPASALWPLFVHHFVTHTHSVCTCAPASAPHTPVLCAPHAARAPDQNTLPTIFYKPCSLHRSPSTCWWACLAGRPENMCRRMRVLGVGDCHQCSCASTCVRKSSLCRVHFCCRDASPHCVIQ